MNIPPSVLTDEYKSNLYKLLFAGGNLFATNDNYEIVIVNPENGNIEKKLHKHLHNIASLNFYDGFLFFVDFKGIFHQIHVDVGDIFAYPFPAQMYRHFKFNGEFMFIAANDYKIEQWNYKNKSLVKFFPCDDVISNMAIIGKYIFVMESCGVLYRWEIYGDAQKIYFCLCNKISVFNDSLIVHNRRGDRGYIEILKAETGKSLLKIECDYIIRIDYMLIADNSIYLVCGTRAGINMLFRLDVDYRQLVYMYNLKLSTQTIYHDKFIFALSMNRSIRQYNFKTGKLMNSFDIMDFVLEHINIIGDYMVIIGPDNTFCRICLDPYHRPRLTWPRLKKDEKMAVVFLAAILFGAELNKNVIADILAEISRS